MNPQCFLEMSRFRCYFFLSCVTAALLYGPTARADFVISVSSATVNAGSTGTLEVDLTNTSTTSAQVFGGFSFGISTSSSGIDFTSATTGTTNQYIFAGDSLFGPNIATSTGQSLIASDFSASGFGDSVAAGQTVGLGEVFFNVASGTSPGVYTVTLAAYPTTSLSDVLGNNLNFTALDGSITVNSPPSAVPEPSTLVLAILASPACAWAVWRRRAAAKRPETYDA